MDCTLITTVRQSAQGSQGPLMDQAAATKLKENATLCQAAGHQCLPFVGNTFGALHLTAREFLSCFIARKASSLGEQPPARIGKMVWSAVTAAAAAVARAACQIYRHALIDQPLVHGPAFLIWRHPDSP